MTSIEVWLARGINRITAAPLGVYQSAVIRIGFSATWLLFLLREFPHRQELYGPDAPWSWSMARELIDGNGAFTALIWTDGQVWFEVVYALAVVSAALLLLGWHTRAVSVLFMVGVLSLENRSIFVSDGGDNVIHLMSIYLVFTRCGAVWSLDARRRRRSARARARGARLRADAVGPVLWALLGLVLAVVSGRGFLSTGWMLVFWGLWAVHGLWWIADRRAARETATVAPTALTGSAAPAAPAAALGGSPSAGGPARDQLRLLLDVIANLAHNAGLLVIMAEACLIYATAGWYKIQGSRWEDGTAVYYPLHLDYFSPWPALSDQLSAHGLVVMVITYGTVMVQVAFPFTLFNRRVKNVLLVAMIIEHTVIAVTLGLPFFSLAMIAADSVFLPTSFLRSLGSWATRASGRLSPRTRRPAAGLPRADGAGGDGGPGEPPPGAPLSPAGARGRHV
ncbi:HTTM domain-containing protein [Streptomyces sulfonofaciens]|uniref:HTTM domain-containing protein n=1 Tax=Streptomyces sulfonofaciens TaxID=68272 RepID=A0A919FR36_9ACTN|nr:HTTM domain-containing protein [Streptomyces sulfonofaciens]GHH70428.1 HTTM domain-containing protein [Streptomyces sulfonofaciens]